MALEAGSTLGHYEVLSSLGAGGMGEVYRAKDTKLGREVAIKLLLEEVSADPERLARFEREARVLASLNHSNIASLHAFERDGDTNFLVMEVVEGETLADRIKRGAIPVDEALPLFIQIAEGLEAAHEKGVIHRDLKPANIKVTDDGNVKILDFGLAKAMAPDTDTAEDGGLSESPTLTLAATQRGEILGTAAYMSPEQASGKAVDKRTDIWAFGACLYEALTGQRVFQGEDAPNTLAAVLRDQPDLEALPVELSSSIRRLVRRSLEKKKQQRIPDIAMARIEIEESLSGLDATTTVVPDRSEQRSFSRGSLATAICALILGSAATGIVVWNRPQPLSQPLPTSRYLLDLPLSQVSGSAASLIALSPDGRTLVFTGEEEGVARLYRRPLDTLEASPILGTEGAYSPFFSSDGASVGFLDGTHIRKVPLSGGTPVSLCEVHNIVRGASWEGDVIVFGMDGVGILRVSGSGGEPEKILTFDSGFVPWRPQLLAGAEFFLFVTGDDGDYNVEVADVATGENRRLLIEDATDPRFVPPGHLVFLRGDAIWAAPFDLDSAQIVGELAPVIHSLRSTDSRRDIDTRARISVSSNGTLAYELGSNVSDTLVWVDRDGDEELLATSDGAASWPRLSPDGMTLALGVTQGARDIWLYDLQRDIFSRLTDFGASWPIWTADGESITFQTLGAGGWLNLHVVAADRSTEPLQLLEGQIIQAPGNWSQDGQTLVYYEIPPSTQRDIWILHEGERSPWLSTPNDERAPVLSPNGRWLAYVSDEEGPDEVFVAAFPGPRGAIKVSSEGGREPLWSRDGRELFYRDGLRMMSVSVQTSGPLSPQRPKILFEGNYARDSNGNPNYDVSLDGQRFVMARQGEDSSNGGVVIVESWVEELERLVPTE